MFNLFGKFPVLPPGFKMIKKGYYPPGYLPPVFATSSVGYTGKLFGTVAIASVAAAY